MKRRRAWWRLAAATILVLVLLATAGHWIHFRATHVYTEDSRVAAREITVSSEVAGRVAAIRVLPGDAVGAGELLVGIDTRQAELELQEAQAEMDGIEARIAELDAQQAMTREQLASRLRAGEAHLAAAEAAHRVSEAILENVQSDYERAESLHARKLIASYRYDDAREALTSASQREAQAAAEVETARAELQVIRADKSKIAVLGRRIAALEAEKTAGEARLEQQRIDLARREISAAFDGVIDETFVDVGEYVAPGRRLLMYHDPQAIWVDANFKETEFRKLALGAPVTITVDAYPGREFHGRVARLGQAATSEFALLPSPNPSGNFTKIAQRLPARITLEQVKGLLRPGMMVEVTVDVID